MSTCKHEGYIIRNDKVGICKLKSDYYRFCKVLARSKDARCLSKAEIFTRDNAEYLEIFNLIKENKDSFFLLSEQDRLNSIRNKKIIQNIASEIKIGTLYLIRGVSGSGKTTMVNNLCYNLGCHPDFRHFEADQFFYTINKDGDFEYMYDKTKIHLAHENCRNNTKKAMENKSSVIFVSNTFTTEKELQPYYDLAKIYHYTVISVIVENRHNGKSVHDLPEDKIKQMKNRFSIKL